jgi:branched-chain amino acid transport system substrate-binding protein
MPKTSRILCFSVAFAGALGAQSAVPCSCGSRPPGAPAPRAMTPYAGTPEDLRPFSKFTKPYFEHYTKLVEYNGAAREAPDPALAGIDEVRIGFLGPIKDHPEEALGKMMLNGATLAIEEANAAGGYCGKPFRLMVHNDQAIWGAASNEIVKLAYDDKVWAMLGSISGDSTHIALRVTLKTEVPIVNSAATDPTIPETIIPWYLTVLQDDRVQCYTLARRIYTDLGLKRVALLRVNDRYGRFGVIKFRDASRRLGRPVVIEQKYMPGDTDFERQLRVINDSRADAIVLWADAGPAGAILKQMRAMGMKQRVFGSFRVFGDALLKNAGPAADGLEVVFPYDPARLDSGFQQRFKGRFAAPPEAFSSLAFDAMKVLLDAVCRAGLNRGRIRDALTGVERYRGVTGQMVFDPNAKNVAPMYLGTIEGGKAQFRVYPMEKPYARVGENGVSYTGPALADLPAGQAAIAVFGPGADRLASGLEVSARYRVVGLDSDVPWGKAVNELVRLLQDERTLGVIATERKAAHLALQLANKFFLPVLALADDRTLTSANIPWIFRMPAETPLAEGMKRFAAAADRAGGNRQRLRDALEDQ